MTSSLENWVAVRLSDVADRPDLSWALGQTLTLPLRLLRDGLANASRTTRIDEIRGEFLAINTALARLKPGDLCLILIDQVQEALAHLAECVKESRDLKQAAVA